MTKFRSWIPVVAVFAVAIIGVLPGLEFFFGKSPPLPVAFSVVYLILVAGSWTLANSSGEGSTYASSLGSRFLGVLVGKWFVVAFLACFGLGVSGLVPADLIQFGKHEVPSLHDATDVDDKDQPLSEKSLPLQAPELCDANGVFAGSGGVGINTHVAMRCYAACEAHTKVVEALDVAGKINTLSGKDIKDLANVAGQNGCLLSSLYWIRQVPNPDDRRDLLWAWRREVCSSQVHAQLLSKLPVFEILQRHGLRTACS